MKIKIDEQDNFSEKIKIQVNNSTAHNGKIYIYGRGKTSRILCDIMKKVMINVDKIVTFVVDVDYYDYRDKKEMCYSAFLKEATQKDLLYFTIDDFDKYSLVKKDLAHIGLVVEWISFPLDVYRRKRFMDYEFVKKNEKEINKVLELLSDEESKKIYCDYIYGCVSGDCSKYFEAKKIPQYFNYLTQKRDVKIIADCGAYTGDSIIDALKLYGESNIEKIYAFEPDQENKRKLENELKIKCIDKNKIVVIECGTWSEKGMLSFEKNGDGSAISCDGDDAIEVDLLDNIVGNKRIDFIKMDIEGSELESLKGAKEIIQKYSPIISVCIYHKIEDVFEIPLFVSEIASGKYDYYVGRHADNFREFVMYMIPR